MVHSDQCIANYKFSASQIENWSGCSRRGAFTYLLELRGHGTPSMDLGKLVHKVLEDYQKYGTVIDTTTLEGRIAIVAVPYIPVGHVAEGYFEFFSGRHLWRGYKDLSAPGHITDYKTTKDFKWKKSSETLQIDPQAMLYAAHEFHIDPTLTEVELTWLYLRTKPPHQAEPVHLRVVRNRAERAMSVLDDMADDVTKIVLGGKGLTDQNLRDYILSLPYNSNECFKYNKPCDFSGLCNLTPIERFASKMNQDTLFARLKLQNDSDDKDTSVSGGGSGTAPPDERGVAVNPPEYQPPPATTPEQDAKAAKVAEAARKVADKAAKAAEKIAKQTAPTVPDITKAAHEAVARVEAKVIAPAPLGTPCIKQLLIGCIANYASVDFSVIVQQARVIVKQEAGVDDWRFIQYTAAGVLLQAVTQILDRMGSIQVLTVDHRAPEANICLGLLRSRAIEIITGVV